LDYKRVIETNSIKKKDVRRVLQDFQYKLSKKKNIYLNACLSECEIILNGQVEPHIKVEFINYPRFQNY
jgi:hypothetical protein